MKCTSVVKNTRNPIFNEVFTFTLSPDDKNIAQLRYALSRSGALLASAEEACLEWVEASFSKR